MPKSPVTSSHGVLQLKLSHLPRNTLLPLVQFGYMLNSRT